MVSKVLKVFYGADYLPYKDSERTIHFPVGGNTFAGTQNTFRICFYPRDLVGSNDLVEQTSWVLVSKLPNGKLGYQLLNAINTDSDLGEKYLVFDLSSYYSQYKGVVKLAIRGYQGEISFVEDEDTGTYSVQGTPIIGVTGTIDIAINYSPMVYGEELLPSELDQLVAKFSEYLSLNAYKEGWLKRIIVVDNLDEEIATLTDTYEYGQLFYNKADKKIYVFDETEDDIILFDNAVKIIEGASNTLTINEVIANGTPVIVVLNNNIRHTRMAYLVSQTQNNTRKTIEAMPLYDNSISYSALNTQLDFSGLFTTLLVNDYKIELATKNYVDEQISSFLQNEYSKVDITEYPTLDSFLASQGEEGYIYLYPINTSDPTQGYYQYIWEDNEWVSLGTTNIDLSGYVEKTNSANKVYGTNELGAQTTYTVDDFYEGNIARRDTDGSITVPLTPTQNGHASSKKYVDDSISNLESEVDDKLEDKANVDGNYPTLTAGLADNLTPYSEDSGAEQDNPFISNGTGTNNNTEIVTVGDYGLLKEKQGNTLVVNQQLNWLTTLVGGTYGEGTINLSIENGKIKIVVNGTRTTNAVIQLGDLNKVANHTYIYRFNESSNLTQYIGYGNGLYITMSVPSGSGMFYSYRITSSSATGSSSYSLVITTTLPNGTYYIAPIYSDLTQWFNGDIPQDLLDNPDHFSWYYNGSLAYNIGSLENANGVKLISTDRNIYNPNETYNVVMPNKPFFASKTTTITYYDKDKNSIGTESVSAGNTFTTPSNCLFINSSVSAITITPYYTEEQGGEGYKNNSNVPIEYPYEQPYVVDTGSEVLRKAGSVCDYKEPNGTIHRLVGNRAYQSSDENDNSLLTDKTTTNYPLETSTTEQGTPFAENLPINDYGMLYWLDSNDNLVGIPQGAKIFYPTNYKGFVDDMYSRVDGDSSAYALNSELNAKFETYLKSLSGYDSAATQVLKNIEGTLTWVTEE